MFVSIHIIIFFFFSSRRRHTRWPRDWSSDVCSSDLPRSETSERLEDNNDEWLAGFLRAGSVSDGLDRGSRFRLVRMLYQARSEERRVGKEGRSRWSAEHEKKKISREWRK